MPPAEFGYQVELGQPPKLLDISGNYVPMPFDQRVHVKTLFVDTDLKSTIPMFHYEVQGATKTMIFSHGNSTDLGYMHGSILDICHRVKVNVLSYEYTGYSCSKGGNGPSENHLYSDITAAYMYLTKKCKINPADIILYGQSVGSAPSCDLARRLPVGGVIIHSGLRSGLSVMHDTAKEDHWFDVFRNAQKIRDVHCPVFIIHGLEDREVRIKHGYALFDNAPNPFAPWWVDGCGHNDIESKRAREYFQRLNEYIQYLHSLPSPSLSIASNISGDNTLLSNVSSRRTTTRGGSSAGPSSRTAVSGLQSVEVSSRTNSALAVGTAAFSQQVNGNTAYGLNIQHNNPTSSSRSTSTIACVPNINNGAHLNGSNNFPHSINAEKGIVNRNINPMLQISQQSTCNSETVPIVRKQISNEVMQGTAQQRQQHFSIAT